MMEETNVALERALEKNKAKDPNLQLETKEVKKLTDEELRDYAKTVIKMITYFFLFLNIFTIFSLKRSARRFF